MEKRWNGLQSNHTTIGSARSAVLIDYVVNR